MLIDLEVLYFLHHGEPPIHRYLHTCIGGVAMGFVAGISLFAAHGIWIRYRPRWIPWEERQRLMPRPKLLRDSVAGGLLGGVSHILLDSCMHHDMHPMWPFARGNPLAGIISVNTLHISLALVGFFGLIFWLLLREA